MKKIFVAISLLFAFSFLTLFITPSVNAVVCSEGSGTQNCDPLNETCQGAAANSPICDRNENTNPISGSDGIILRASAIISYVVGIVCVIIIIVGAIRYILSQGDSSTVASAKSQILYALVGLVITILARSIIVFVVNRL